MKILFVGCYVDNSHFICHMKETLDKNLINCSYDFVCLNDAPDIENGEENYLKICDILSGDENSFKIIKETAEKNNFTHIKIPQNIHIKDRPNHGSPRHIENLNWFNSNIDTLIPNYKEYDFLCHIDSDALLCKKIDLNIELYEYDIAGPFIYLNNNFYYIHTGLFFINLKTVVNMNEISWNNTMCTDTGSDIGNFIGRNPQYKIKKLGHYDGYSSNNIIANGHTISKLIIDDINDEDYKLIDVWFDKRFFHFRAGSCFGVGTDMHRNNERFNNYLKKYHAFLELLE
jgi:hypothetical protein